MVQTYAFQTKMPMIPTASELKGDERTGFRQSRAPLHRVYRLSASVWTIWLTGLNML
jgi:hypothetical protein